MSKIISKITLKIDLDKIDPSKVQVRSFKNRSNVEVKVREYEFEMLPLREEKVIVSKPNYDLVKVGFLSEKSTKNQDGTWRNGLVIGEAVEFRKKEGKADVKTGGYEGGFDNPEDIPF